MSDIRSLMHTKSAEELLALQNEFLASKAPSSTRFRVSRREVSSPDEVGRAPQRDPGTSFSSQVFGDVLERASPSIEVSQSAQTREKSPVPAVSPRAREESSVPVTSPPSVARRTWHALSARDHSEIHEENVRTLSNLSHEEILKEREELLSNVDPRLLTILKNAKQSPVTRTPEVDSRSHTSASRANGGDSGRAAPEDEDCACCSGALSSGGTNHEDASESSASSSGDVAKRSWHALSGKAHSEIHSENMRTLEKMSHEAIVAERERLMREVDPSLLEMLRCNAQKETPRESSRQSSVSGRAQGVVTQPLKDGEHPRSKRVETRCDAPSTITETSTSAFGNGVPTKGKSLFSQRMSANRRTLNASREATNSLRSSPESERLLVQREETGGSHPNGTNAQNSHKESTTSESKSSADVPPSRTKSLFAQRLADSRKLASKAESISQMPPVQSPSTHRATLDTPSAQPKQKPKSLFAQRMMASRGSQTGGGTPTPHSDALAQPATEVGSASLTARPVVAKKSLFAQRMASSRVQQTQSDPASDVSADAGSPVVAASNDSSQLPQQQPPKRSLFAQRMAQSRLASAGSFKSTDALPTADKPATPLPSTPGHGSPNPAAASDFIEATLKDIREVNFNEDAPAVSFPNSAKSLSFEERKEKVAADVEDGAPTRFEDLSQPIEIWVFDFDGAAKPADPYSSVRSPDATTRRREEDFLTLRDVFRFCRSSVPSQRAIHMQVLRKIIIRARSGRYGKEPSSRVLRHLDEFEFVALMVASLSDSSRTVVSASLSCLHSFVVPMGGETLGASTMTFDVLSRGETIFSLHPKRLDAGSPSFNTSGVSRMLPVQVCARDLTWGLLELDILLRLRYLLEVVALGEARVRVSQSSNSSTASAKASPMLAPILDILVRVAQHSREAAVRVAKCPRLLDVVTKLCVGAVEDSKVIKKSIHLLRLICAADRSFIDEVSKRSRVLTAIRKYVDDSIGCTASVEYTEGTRIDKLVLAIEVLNLWRTCHVQCSQKASAKVRSSSSHSRSELLKTSFAYCPDVETLVAKVGLSGDDVCASDESPASSQGINEVSKLVSLRNRSLCNLYAAHIELFAPSETSAETQSEDGDVTAATTSSNPDEKRKTLKERSPRRLLPRGSLTEPFDPNRSNLPGSSSTFDSSGVPIPFPGMCVILDHLERLVDHLTSIEVPDDTLALQLGGCLHVVASFLDHFSSATKTQNALVNRAVAALSKLLQIKLVAPSLGGNLASPQDTVPFLAAFGALATMSHDENVEHATPRGNIPDRPNQPEILVSHDMVSGAIRMDVVYSILKCIRSMLRLGHMQPLRRTIMGVQQVLRGLRAKKVAGHHSLLDLSALCCNEALGIILATSTGPSRAELFAEAAKLFARLPCGMDDVAVEICHTVLFNEEFVKSVQNELQKERVKDELLKSFISSDESHTFTTLRNMYFAVPENVDGDSSANLYVSPSESRLPRGEQWSIAVLMDKLLVGVGMDNEDVVVALNAILRYLGLFYAVKAANKSHDDVVSESLLLRAVCEAFMFDSDVFFDECVDAPLQSLLRALIENQGSESVTEVAAAWANEHYPFFLDLFQQYCAESLGSEAFGRCVLHFLRREFPSDFAEVIWTETGLITASAGFIVPGDNIAMFLKPAGERSRHLLWLYEHALCEQILVKSKHAFLYTVAIYHLAIYIFQDAPLSSSTDSSLSTGAHSSGGAEVPKSARDRFAPEGSFRNKIAPPAVALRSLCSALPKEYLVDLCASPVEPAKAASWIARSGQHLPPRRDGELEIAASRLRTLKSLASSNISCKVHLESKGVL